MSDTLFPVNPNAISVQRYATFLPEGDRAPHNVRVYRYSPDRVMLQIRGEKMLTNVTLPFDTAQLIASALVTESR